MSGAIYSKAGSVITGYTTLRTNLITNPDFESATTGWTAQGGSTITRVTTEFYSGGACARVVTPGIATSEGIFWSPVAVAGLAAGSKFSAAVWVKAPVGAALQLFAISTGAGGANSITAFTGTGAWQLVKAENATLGASLNPYLVINTRSPIQGITFYVDLGTVCLGTTIGDPFSGNTVDELDPPGPDAREYSWSGTANASQSRERQPIYAGTFGTLPHLKPLLTSSSRSRNRIQWIIGRADPTVAYAEAGLRTGRLELFYATDEAAASEAELMFRQGTMFRLDYPDRPEWEMVFVVDDGGQIERELIGTNHWMLRVDYQEIDGADY